MRMRLQVRARKIWRSHSPCGSSASRRSGPPPSACSAAHSSIGTCFSAASQSPAPISTGWKWSSRSERRGGADRRQGIEEAVAMPRLQVVMPDDEPDNAVQPRAEELRLLEAMLFASAEPLDEKSLAARLPQGTNVREALV